MRITNKQIRSDYTIRLNKVFEFIEANLDSELSLHKVSEIASFSPFHFHRIFKYITEEPLAQYINRRRVETSALDLLHKSDTITQIAFKYGFSDNSSYSKAFKKYFKVSPSIFKKQNSYRHHKIAQLNSKNGQGYPDFKKYICIINNLNTWIDMNAKITIKEIKKMNLAYVSSIGVQNLQGAYEKLMKWAIPKGLVGEESKMVTIYYDSFKVTQATQVRMSACVLLNNPVATEGEVGLTSIEDGKCIVGRFEIEVEEFEKSWTGLFLWMNKNGYTKADRPPFEIYHNNFNEHPEKKAIVDFYIPIE